MSADALQHGRLSSSDSRIAQWVFGYGSLNWKADFPFNERRRAQIHGWARRFWQGSHDHRGTLQALGRMVTRVGSAGFDCVEVAYLVSAEVFSHLEIVRRTFKRACAPRSRFTTATIYCSLQARCASSGPMIRMCSRSNDSCSL